MSTRSRIGVQLDDSRVLHVYCHWDGSPAVVGKCLRDFYQKRSDVIELIRLGDISTLGRDIWPKGRHNFYNPQPGVCVFFGRDREPNSDQYVPKIDLLTNYPPYPRYMIDYFYLYDLSDCWSVFNNFHILAKYKVSNKQTWVPLLSIKI